ncbi:MAG: RdgB/HAM1 family non-canonical purine NTP pyrophosphatase [Slackia sp.]|nr:RdgB/HAM1 family non-canonical purine NTP pyrophosphatase [Slackia sp.]
MRKVVIATNNAHKVEEIRSALDFEGWEFVTLSQCPPYDEPIEDADTFEGNARIKARAAHAHTGYAALADDSGLVVDALGGAPGVLSARYAGTHGDDEANNAKLLEELADVEDGHRTARFVCSLVFIDEQGREVCASGSVEGRIARSAAGAKGFGYDPLFLPDAFGGKTSLAEVSQDEKNAISHRGNALRALKDALA